VFRQNMLLILLDLAGKIRGSTRLQKEVFLAQKEANVPFGYDFELYHYGPFSSQIFSDIEDLEKNNLIRREISTITTLEGTETKRIDYTLTPEGKHLAASLTSNRHRLKEIVDKYNDKPLWELLRYVYGKYVWPKKWPREQSTLASFLE